MKPLLAALAATVFLAIGPAAAKDCRPVEALPGVPASAVGCPTKADREKPARVERLEAGRAPGFIDLGGGTSVRVGGQVRVETGIRR